MVRATPTQQDRDTEPQTVRGPGLIGKLMAGAVAIVAVAVLIVVLSAVSLLPRLHNPFGETTSVRSGPVLIKSITALSRFEAASGSFQVVVNLTHKANLLPAFLEGSQTLFVGQGSEIAYVDFGQLKGSALQVSANRTAVSQPGGSQPRASLDRGTVLPHSSPATVSAMRARRRSRFMHSGCVLASQN